ncbi:hypothetical protein BDV39DRAFT_169793 [Aspergillus sergii]|uniref:Uncharacterized protein n=1 Tax=Aspergillus sergii TaxID=1034303 RepID=A0A5N6XG18_9EURO|nr:hypothetical protein BDV39DRAFT_169793 [Aspergillus sergii]
MGTSMESGLPRVMPPLTSFSVSHFVHVFISLKGMSMKKEQSSLSDHTSQAITAFRKSLRQHRLVPIVSSKANKGFNGNVFRSLSSSPNEKQGWSGGGRRLSKSTSLDISPSEASFHWLFSVVPTSPSKSRVDIRNNANELPGSQRLSCVYVLNAFLNVAKRK